MDWDEVPGALDYAMRYFMDVDGVAKWYTNSDPYPGVNQPSAARAYFNLRREANVLYRERLTDADWRYQELLDQFKTMINALPALADAAAPRPKRRWWPFR